MELTIPRKQLLDALYLAQGIVERRVTLPILSHVLLKAEDQTLEIIATDQELGLRQRCTASVDKVGTVTAAARLLYDIVRSLPEEDVSLRTIDRQRLEVRCGRSQFRMAGLNPADFPAMPTADRSVDGERVAFSTSDLRRMLQRTAFCVCSDDTRLSLAGIFFDRTQAGVLKLAATDGHRLSLVQVTMEGMPTGKGVIVPRKGVQEIAKILESSDGEVGIRFSSAGLVFVEREGLELAIRNIQGEFPDYKQVIRDQSPCTAEVQVGLWAEALRRVAVLSNERTHRVKLQFEPGNLEVSSMSPELGDAVDSFEISYVGQPLALGFNFRYLLDALDTFSRTATATVGLKDEASPAVITVDEDPTFLYVVMPMRLP